MMFSESAWPRIQDESPWRCEIDADLFGREGALDLQHQIAVGHRCDCGNFLAIDADCAGRGALPADHLEGRSIAGARAAPIAEREPSRLLVRLEHMTALGLVEAVLVE